MSSSSGSNGSGAQESLLDQYIASHRAQGDRCQTTAMSHESRASHQGEEEPASTSPSIQGRHRGSTSAAAPTAASASQPCAQVTETSGFLRLCLDLPGVHARDIEVTVNRGVLMIRGVRKTMSVDRSVVIKKAQFLRRFAIDTDVVDVSQAKANLSKGVLVVMAPKKHAPHCIHIPVTEDPGDSWIPFHNHHHHHHHHHHGSRRHAEEEDNGVSTPRRRNHIDPQPDMARSENIATASLNPPFAIPSDESAEGSSDEKNKKDEEEERKQSRSTHSPT